MSESKKSESCKSSIPGGIPGMDMKSLYDTWEKATGAWFETWSKSPAFLAAMGQTLEAQLGMKSTTNKLFENVLEAWRVPTARDIETLTERLAALEERMGSVEEAIGEPAVASGAKAETR